MKISIYNFMQYKSINEGVKNDEQQTENTASSVLYIIKNQNNEIPTIIHTDEKFVNAKNKVLKQLDNIYKNTRLSKFEITNSQTKTQINYKRIKGLVLNIEKRMCWYLNLDPESVRCLLISIKARTAMDDLIYDDRNNSFFEYYCKFIFPINGEKRFVTIPLINLNVSVI